MAVCKFEECDGSGFIVDTEARTTRPCRCRPFLVQEAKARRLSAKLPQRYKGVSFDRAPVTDIDPHVVAEVRRYVRDLDANLDAGKGMWLMGDVGTGKTTLAMLISKSALEAGRTVAIYSLPRLLSELRKTYDENAEQSFLGLIDSLTAVDLLHIDDVGTERTNEWVLEQLYTIVNARYEEEKSVVITTNLSPDELEEQIKQRTVSRLHEICGDPLPLFGPDNRRPEDALPEPAHPGSIKITPLGYGQAPS